MMGPSGTNPVHIDSQGNHVEPPSAAEQKLVAIRAECSQWRAYYPDRSCTSWEFSCRILAVLDSDDTTGEK